MILIPYLELAHGTTLKRPISTHPSIIEQSHTTMSSVKPNFLQTQQRAPPRGTCCSMLLFAERSTLLFAERASSSASRIELSKLGEGIV